MITLAHAALLVYAGGYGAFVSAAINDGIVDDEGWFVVLLVLLLWPVLFLAGMVNAATKWGGRR